MLSFNEQAHEYRWSGVLVPSVTQILRGAMNFAGVPAEVMAAAQLRGSNVHLLCEYHDRGVLDESEFVESELAYLPAWKRFLVDVKPTFAAIEESGYEGTYSFAGTPDRIAEIRGEEWVLDIKTGTTRSPWWSLQLAAYARLAKVPGARRGSVQLANDGRYRLHEWKSPSDWPTFVAAVTIQRWAKENL